MFIRLQYWVDVDVDGIHVTAKNVQVDVHTFPWQETFT